MIQNFFNKFYPYLSIGVIEVGKEIPTWIEHFQNLSELVGVIFQVVIGALTVIKLGLDFKNKLKNKDNGK